MSLQFINEKLENIERLLKDQALQCKKILGMEDVMYLLGVSKKTLYRMIRQKKIPAYRPVKGKVFFLPKELRYWIMSTRNTHIWSVEKLDSAESDTSDIEQ